MKIYIGSDHTGVEVRQAIINYLENQGIEVVDLGTQLDKANYAEIGISVGEHVINDPGSLGIAICGTGIGISIACNKVSGIRCALVDRIDNASLIKEHNNANVLALGARTTSLDDMLKIIDAYINTPFAGGRHQERLQTISDYEQKK